MLFYCNMLLYTFMYIILRYFITLIFSSQYVLIDFHLSKKKKTSVFKYYRIYRVEIVVCLLVFVFY